MKLKKILFLLIIFFVVKNPCFAQTYVDFIYINGSNNNNPKMYNWFIKGINKFHPTLKQYLESDEYAKKYMLKDGQYTILPAPSNFFWGYKSHQDLMFMKSKADMLRSISPIVAFFVRNTISDIMHDAIWVQKPHNMLPIVDDLDKQVKKDYKKGNKVILLGYSAGCFVTFEYLFTKMPYINIAEFFEKENLSEDLRQMINKNHRKNTCMMAFVGSNLTNASPMDKITVNTNKSEFIDAYMNMDAFTDRYCVPDDEVIGVINYASPLPLFYSDMADRKFGTFQYLHLMYKYLIEHEFFFLTVNYADDPLGFPNGVNYTNKQIKNVTNLNFDEEKGFFYDYSKALSWRTFAGAHTSYWSTRKHFSKVITKAYKEGREFQYGQN